MHSYIGKYIHNKDLNHISIDFSQPKHTRVEIIYPLLHPTFHRVTFFFLLRNDKRQNSFKISKEELEILIQNKEKSRRKHRRHEVN